MVIMVNTTVTAAASKAYWLHRLARPQWKPVAAAFRYSVSAKRPANASPISPMYFQGYMAPSGIGGCANNGMFGLTFSPKTSPIWGTRYRSAGTMFSRPKSAVNPKAPIVTFRDRVREQRDVRVDLFAENQPDLGYQVQVGWDHVQQAEERGEPQGSHRYVPRSGARTTGCSG